MSDDRRRPYRHASEAELLDWARGGDQRAFAALVEPNRRVVMSVCQRIVDDHASAQDAAQAALLAAWQNLARFEGRAKFSTWLCQIAHNAALAQVRRKRPEPVGVVPDRAPAGGSSTADTVATVHAVRWALAKLPPDFRAALVLREYANLTYDEIAEAQRIPVATVKTRIARARQGMAALLSETGSAGVLTT